MAGTQDQITCKACGHTDPLTKKLKCSKCGAKDWGHQLPKSNKGCLWEILGAIVVMGALIAYVSIKDYNDTHWDEADIEKHFSNNIVLVYHEFVYELQFDNKEDGSLYFIRTEEGGFTQWQKGMRPNAVTGCGFVTKTDGTCITTRKLTYPWLNDQDMAALKREVWIFRQAPFNIKAGGQWKLFTIKRGYYLPGSKMSDPASFVACKVTGSWDEGVEQISPVDSTANIPVKTEFYRTRHLTGLQKEEIIFFAGFPIQFSREEKLSPLITKSKIDSVPYPRFAFKVPSLFTMEGAAVFTGKGNVVGLLSVDEQGKIEALNTNFERIKKE